MYRVLVCDDDKAILDSIKIYLDSEGYEVLTASDGIEALEIVEKNEIHCLVLDVMMPRLDGLRTAIKVMQRYKPYEK